MSAEDKKAVESAIEKLRFQKENFGFMERFTVDENWVALQALEKQIPKKPIDNIEYPICPNCGKPFYYGCIDRYCVDCGQKIDWSECK